MSQYVPPSPQATQKAGMSGLKIALIIVAAVVLVVIVPCVGIMVAVAIPSFLRAREISRRNACQENLSRVDGAKQQWALDNNKTSPSDAPTWAELVANGKYLHSSPVCPSGGTYQLNDMSETPSCSLSAEPPFPHEFPGMIQINGAGLQQDLSSESP